MGKQIKTEKLKVGKDSPPGLKLAYWFWMELGRPSQFYNQKTLKAWSPRMESLLAKSGLDYERFKWFLVWVTRLRDANGANYGNDYTATYLRAARDPAATLGKHFNEVFFNFFMPRADKRIPLLMEIRGREDEEKAARQKPVTTSDAEKPLRYIDLLENWVRLYVRVDEQGVASVRGVANIRMRLEHLDALDDAFPMLQPLPWESMEDWVDRETAILQDDENWRCEHCVYAFSIDGGDDARIKLCPDCEGELIMWAQDDLEWMHDREAPSDWTPWEWATVPLGEGNPRYPQYGYQRPEMLPVVLAPRKKCPFHTSPCTCPRVAQNEE